MRKLVIFCHMSLDGIVAVKGGGLDWISYDTELEKWAEPIVAETDTALYGNTTYEMMKYWKTVLSDPKASKHEREHAKWIEDVEKIVFSKDLTNPDWNNASVMHEVSKEEIYKLKQKPGKNITVFGSPSLAHALMQAGLVDELRLSVSPVVVGSGTHLFAGITEKMPLKLLEQKTLGSGVVTLHYSVA